MSALEVHAADTAAAGPRVRTAMAGDEPAVLTLDDRGMICNCNRACEALFKYRRSDLVWRHVSMLLPQLAGSDLMPGAQPNPRLRFLARIGCHFQAVTRDGERFASELYFNSLGNSERGQLSLIVRPAEGTVRLDE